MAAYEKTAKDIAWDKERLKLKSTISKQQHEINALRMEVLDKDDEILSRDRMIQDLKAEIQMLLNYNNMSEEDLQTLIQNKKKQNEAIDMFESLAKFHGITYNNYL